MNAIFTDINVNVVMTDINVNIILTNINVNVIFTAINVIVIFTAINMNMMKLPSDLMLMYVFVGVFVGCINKCIMKILNIQVSSVFFIHKMSVLVCLNSMNIIDGEIETFISIFIIYIT